MSGAMRRASVLDFLRRGDVLTQSGSDRSPPCNLRICREILTKCREPGDGEIGWRVAVGARGNDARRNEGERSQQADVALAKTFAVRDLSETGNAPEPEVF